MTEEINKPLLPDFIKKPYLLLLTAALPQVALLLINGWTLWLVSGEAKVESLGLFGSLFAAQAALLAVALGAWYTAREQKTYIPWPWLLILFLGQIGFLWFFVTGLGQMIPGNVDRWIVDEGMLLFYAFSLMMPGIFYTGMQLACFELPISRSQNFWGSILALTLAPAIFYVIFLPLRMIGHESQFVYMFLWPLFFVGLTVITFVGMLRLAVLGYNWISERGELGQMLFAILIGIVGPIGGLALNRGVPFPADFQSLPVYLVAIINGVVVLLPRIKRFENGLLFLRSTTYPFSLYFFLVFLPFLPLALPAMFALGFGFLFLVPVLLFILHTKKIADDFKESAARSGIQAALLLIVLGVSILPGYLVWQAYSDKSAVKEALRYVYSPDYEADQSFKGNLKATQQVLLNLKRFKEGNQLPYISDFYNRVVFEGMVLPDQKIADMYRIFTGEDIAQAGIGAGWQMRNGLGFLGSERSRGMAVGRARPVDHNVVLESSRVQVVAEGDYLRARLNLVMHNTGSSSEAEYLANINVPPGVIITDFQLRVAKDMVAGQIFEKRTAQWVYHMIRDFVQRDPGLLSYKTPEQVELRVYPFTQGEKREAEIAFEFPANFMPVVQIGDRTISLIENETEVVKEILRAADPQGNTFLFVPGEQARLLPKLKRQPYLHFILDRSQKGLENLSGYLQQIETVAAQYPQVQFCRLTAANFSLEDVSGMVELKQKDAIRTALRRIVLKRQGGLDLERVIKSELCRYARQLGASALATDWQMYPVFVVLTPNKMDMAEIKDVDPYRNIIPEGGDYLVASKVSGVEKRALWAQSGSVEEAGVTVVKHGAQVSFLTANGGQVARFPAAAGAGSSEFLAFDPDQGQFISVGAVQDLSDQGMFINKLSLQWADRQALLNPAIREASLSGLVKESRRLGVLIPSTSFIVVERSVQWKALQINEKKRLKTASAFEFEEEFKTPAPSFWLLAVLFAVFLVLKQWHYRTTRNMAKHFESQS
ncbi:MAG: MSEP-CTERM sorting domain-containing protein [Candidatus Omnitrophica bacterium]|nr:MSEP-CTERM sorting domain-containing protein [Candidatus Omnitrophota bacterium]